MRAHLAPAWDVRHRVAVGFGCAVVAVAAICAGAMQQAWGNAEDWQRDFWGELDWIGLGGVAAIFFAFSLCVAASFLIPSRRVAVVVVLLLTVATAWPLFAMAWRIFTALFNPPGMKSVM